MQSSLTLVLGGTRSGKSEFAEHLAQKWGEKVTYIATAACLDEEMVRRVAKHRQSRPAHWPTVEATQEVPAVLEKVAPTSQVILIDCLTLLVSNLLFQEQNEEGPLEVEKRVLTEIEELAIKARESQAKVIIVSSEVGLGLVPDNELGRLYRDILGKANQIMAREARNVYLVIAGIPVELKALSQQLKERINNEY